MQNLVIDGENVPVPTPLPWYPGRLAWHFEVPKQLLKKSDLLQQFREYIINETEEGAISRQEAVSMIPPLFLDVKPKHKVLDMCAAPGSKTCQLLESLHQDSLHNEEGLVIANDVEFDRCLVLAHHAKRASSAALIVSSHSAEHMPLLRCPAGPLLFDRVLCDVPCSSDGTFRKNVDLWKKWGYGMGCGMHKIQSQILHRGIQLLKPGGRLVYSTCSMNPIEDEAVVAAALSGHEDVELMDVSDTLPELKRASGVSTWEVRDTKLGIWLQTFDQVPEKEKHRILASFFPPSADTVGTLRLDRCMRVLPHYQDTGGFFVAVFHKKELQTKVPAVAVEGLTSSAATLSCQESCAALPAGDGSRLAVAAEEQPSVDKACRKEVFAAKKGRPPLPKTLNDVLRPLAAKHALVLDSIRDFYGLSASFAFDQLMTSSDSCNKIYYVNRAVKDILTSSARDYLTVFHAGLRVFAKTDYRDTTCSYRLLQEGAHLLLPFMTKRVIHATEGDFRMLLSKKQCMVWEFPTPETRAAIHALSHGVAVMVLIPNPERSLQHTVCVVAWRSKDCLKPFLSRSEAVSLGSKLGCTAILTDAVDVPPIAQDITDEVDDCKACNSTERAEDADGGEEEDTQDKDDEIVA